MTMKKWINIYIFPGLLFLAFAFLCHEMKWDIYLTEHFIYDNGFPFKNSFIFEQILHKAAAKLVIVFYLYLLVKIFITKGAQNKKFYLYSFVTGVISLGVVAYFKTLTVINCPWSLEIFGGTGQFVHFWQMFSHAFPVGNCFPAGHSSGGYSLLGLFFAGLIVFGRANLKLLIPGIFIGGLLGLTQQIRGAHFLSHDLMTISLCILINLIMSLLFIRFQNEKN